MPRPEVCPVRHRRVNVDETTKPTLKINLDEIELRNYIVTDQKDVGYKII